MSSAPQQKDANGNGTRVNIQPNSFAASGRSGITATMKPHLQQEILLRQEPERNFAATSTSAQGLAFPSNDHEMELLNQRENELIRLRNAHNQIMEEELVARGQRLAAGAAGSDDSFRAEYIERIVALQEQRQREAELLMSLPGRQLGQYPFNVLQQPNQLMALNGAAPSRFPNGHATASFNQGLLSANGYNLQPFGMACAQGAHDQQLQLLQQQVLAKRQENQQAALRNQAIMGAAGMAVPNSSTNQQFMNLQQQQLGQLNGNQILGMAQQMHSGGPSYMMNGKMITIYLLCLVLFYLLCKIKLNPLLIF